jgi:hypothetical protein
MGQLLTDHAIIPVEDLVVLWCLRYASLSNVEFAHLSNVSKRWREAAQRAVVEQVSSPNVGETLLLLPSMVRYIMASNSSLTGEAKLDTVCDDPTFLGDNNRHNTAGQELDKDQKNHDTFCAAWFHPSGIQEFRISLSNNATSISISDDDHSQSTSKSPHVVPAFAPNGEPTYEASDNDDNKDDARSSKSSRKQQIKNPQRSKSPSISKGAKLNGASTTAAPTDDRIATCYEWRGYRTAIDVLCSFSYSASFVEDVLNSILLTTGSDVASSNSITKEIHNLLPKENHSVRSRTTNTIYRDTTYAVRGAVISRPESYCDCVDLDIERLRALRLAHTANGDGDAFNNIRVQEYKQSIIRKEIRRRQLQRDVLPRIVKRTNPSEDNRSIQSNGENTTARYQNRCVQFLNANGGHAVCMLTPPFACGPLVEPVTVFCVGIATEDGCFLSGLHHRFELGHLYPNNEIAEIAEQSPVCISTECWGTMSHQDHTLDQNGSVGGTSHDILNNDASIHTCEDDDNDLDGEEDDNDAEFRVVSHKSDDDDDDDSCDGSGEEEFLSRKCDCLFNGVGEKISALDEGKPRIIHRGRLGPGEWHCYVAVFDGENSLIRIDGVSEPMKTEIPDMEPGTLKTKATLDGLTIGSDHCFGMSLCCGNGSGGEGEGAIAELAVFQGRLDLTDIQALEKKWMKQHFLPVVQVTNDESKCASTVGEFPISETGALSVWRENDFVRQAHALFFLPETEDGTATLPSSSTPTRIPLRFLSRHRSVAWRQANPVTGEPIRVQRIGCKPGGASSSDL